MELLVRTSLVHILVKKLLKMIFSYEILFSVLVYRFVASVLEINL